MTRAEFATVVWRTAGSPSASGGSQFFDVPTGSFYDQAVRWMAAQGITTGTSPDRFSPHDPVSRAQAITFLWRDAGSPDA